MINILNLADKCCKKLLTAQLFYVILLSVLFKSLYYGYLQPFSTFADTDTYLVYSVRDLSVRTPVYPFIISVLRFLFGDNNLLTNIVLFQDIVLFASIPFFYWIVRRMYNNRLTIFVATTIYACFPSILNYTRCILTESLALSFLVIFVYLFSVFLRKPSKKISIVVGFFMFVLVMTRPFFICIVPASLVVLATNLYINKSCREEWAAGIGSVALCVVMLGAYCTVNFVQSDMFTISKIGPSNVLAALCGNGLYRNGTDEVVSNAVTTLHTTAGDCLGVAFKVGEELGFSRVSRFVTSAIVNNPAAYMRYLIRTIVSTSRTNIGVCISELRITSTTSPLVLFFLNSFLVPFGFVYLLLLSDIIITVANIATSGLLSINKFMVWVFLVAQVLTTFVGGSGDWSRLFFPAYPLVIILFFYYVDYAIDFTLGGIRKRKRSYAKVG